ncbi:MAG: glycosyltransferase family 2 protein [Vicinamibacteria bacterium]
MKLGVVVLNWNAVEDTERSIVSVQAWSAERLGGRPALWVVDNGSQQPGIESLSERYPEVHFLRNSSNEGFAAANNLGIVSAMKSGADAVLLLNSDASLDERSVASMLATLASQTRIGVVGPTLWDGNKLLAAGGRDIARFNVTHLIPSHPPTELLDVDYVPGTAALVSRQVFETVGLLDEDYFFSGEMADLCCRARRQGFRCVVDPSARASHDLSRSAEVRDSLHVYYIFRNRFLYARKHHPRHKTWHYTVWTLRGAAAAMRAVAKGNVRRARTIGLSVLDGLSGRFGGQNDRVLT